GCVGCPLASKDTALDAILKNPAWSYLAPLKRLKGIYRELRLPQNRLRKTGKDSSEKNRQRMGPLTMEARQKSFWEILAIQKEVAKNTPVRLQRYPIDILNSEE